MNDKFEFEDVGKSLGEAAEDVCRAFEKLADSLNKANMNTHTGKAYYYIMEDGIREAYDMGTPIDKYRKRFGNYYPTFQAAEEFLNKQKKEEEFRKDFWGGMIKESKRQQVTEFEWYRAGLEDMQHIFERLEALRAEGHVEEIKLIFDGYNSPEFRLPALQLIKAITYGLSREQIREWFPNLHSPEQVNEEIEKQLEKLEDDNR